jgi:hypothetical protein
MRIDSRCDSGRVKTYFVRRGVLECGGKRRTPRRSSALNEHCPEVTGTKTTRRIVGDRGAKETQPIVRSKKHNEAAYFYRTHYSSGAAVVSSPNDRRATST